MPELPEVETIVRDLQKNIQGDVIVDFWSDWKKSLKNISFSKFKKEIQGIKILEIKRIGKNIFLNLSNKKTIYIHLKMTGHLLIKTKKKKNKYFEEKVNQYIHHIWFLCSVNCQQKKRQRKIKKNDYDKTLAFSDLRKFAKIKLIDTSKIENLSEIKNLGTDVNSKEFTLKNFLKLLERKPQSLIGNILMNQKVMAGIGNIYRSEILFDAKISPFRKVKDLSAKEKKNIYKSIKKIIQKAIQKRGTSDSDYRDTQGRKGNFHNYLRVYHKEGEKCWRCPGRIVRDKIGQRSVFWCKECQK